MVLEIMKKRHLVTKFYAVFRIQLQLKINGKSKLIVASNTYISWKDNVAPRLSPRWLCGNSCTWAHDVRLHITGTNETYIFMITYISCSSCFCEIWAVFVSWVTYDHLYYAACLSRWALFGSLLPAIFNRTSCAQVHELPQSHCGDSREGTFFSW